MNQWKRNFFTIWTGQAISQFSSSILQFGLVWYLTDKTGSAIILSAAMLMGYLPQALLGPFIGVYIDRYNRKTIMILSDLFIAAVSLILVGAGISGEIPPFLILTVMFLRSVGTAFHQPSLQAITPQLVPQDQLARCAGYSQSLESISQIASPALAAMLYSSWKLNSIVFLDVMGAILAVGALSVCKVPDLDRMKEKAKARVLAEAREGFQILQANRGMMGLVMITAIYTFAMMPVSALFPLISMSYFGGSSSFAGAVEMSFSIGMLIGALILGKWGGTRNKIYTIISSYLLMTACLIGTGILPPQAGRVFVVLAAVMGISGPFYWGMFHTLIQEKFKPEYLGRIMSLSRSLRLITAPLGLAVSGVFAEQFGVENWFLIAGAFTLAASCLCIFVPVIRNCDAKPEKRLHNKA